VYALRAMPGVVAIPEPTKPEAAAAAAGGKSEAAGGDGKMSRAGSVATMEQVGGWMGGLGSGVRV